MQEEVENRTVNLMISTSKQSGRTLVAAFRKEHIAMIQKVHFGKRIAGHRKRLGYSQAELSERLGVTSQAVSKWETGAALPDIDLLLELSHL